MGCTMTEVDQSHRSHNALVLYHYNDVIMSPVTGEFPAQRASYAENVSIWWRHHDPTMHHSEQKCVHYNYESCIVWFVTNVSWDLWNWAIQDGIPRDGCYVSVFFCNLHCLNVCSPLTRTILYTLSSMGTWEARDFAWVYLYIRMVVTKAQINMQRDNLYSTYALCLHMCTQ